MQNQAVPTVAPGPPEALGQPEPTVALTPSLPPPGMVGPMAPPAPSPPPPRPEPDSFHGANTVIFDVPKASNLPPMQRQMPSPASAPRPLPKPTAPSPGGRQKKRQVVVGGAAKEASQALTQAYDVSVIEDAAEKAKLAAQRSSPPSAPMAAGPPGAAPGPPPRQPRQMVVGSPQDSGVTDQHVQVAVGSRRPIWLFILVGLFVTAVTYLLLALFGVLPNLGFLPTISSEEGTGQPTVEQPATDHPAVRIDVLLRNLRRHVEPTFLSAGGFPSETSTALAVAPNDSGMLRYWIARPHSPDPTESDGALAQVSGDSLVYLLIDQNISVTQLVEVVSQLRASGVTPLLTAGSHMGQDVYHVFDASGTGDTGIMIRILSRAVIVNTPSSQETHQYCSHSYFPTDEVRRVTESDLGRIEQAEVRIELAPDTSIQASMRALQAVYREGVRFQISLATETTSPPECN